MLSPIDHAVARALATALVREFKAEQARSEEGQDCAATRAGTAIAAAVDGTQVSNRLPTDQLQLDRHPYALPLNERIGNATTPSQIAWWGHKKQIKKMLARLDDRDAVSTTGSKARAGAALYSSRGKSASARQGIPPAGWARRPDSEP
jgi:hypothetical protein